MAERWGRIAAGIHRNPKVRLAGRNAREVFIYAICTNADGAYRGRLPRGFFGPNYLASELLITPEEAAQGLDACLRSHGEGLGPLLAIDESEVVIVGWTDEEWGGPKSTARVQALRARRKHDETLHSVSKHDETPETPETQIRSEKKREEKRSGTRADRNHPIPADWAPSPKHRDLAREVGADVDTEAANFRDDAIAKGKVFKDWDAAFRTWLRRSPTFRRSGTAAPARGPKPPPLKLLGVD